MDKSEINKYINSFYSNKEIFVLFNSAKSIKENFEKIGGKHYLDILKGDELNRIFEREEKKVIKRGRRIGS